VNDDDGDGGLTPHPVPPMRNEEPWPDPVDGRTLVNEIREVLLLFVVLPTWAAEILALWVLHTYAFMLRETSTYIGIESPEPQCGKTTLMTVLSELVNRPVAVSNISPPAFFHAIAELRPTLFIDEGDTILPGNSELRGILNSGYKRKLSYVLRMASQRKGEGTGGGSRLASYSCFCPKAIAQIGHLPDPLADRCIIIRMRQKTKDEECGRLRTLDGARLRRQCARFVKDHAEAIASANPEIPGTLSDRSGDIGEPLLVLADLVGGDWPERARQALIGLCASAQKNNPGHALLQDIQVVFTSTGVGRIFSRELVAALNALVGRPWAETRKGKPITGHWLAQQLRRHDVLPKTIWIGEAHAKGYLKEDFDQLGGQPG
jgi:hypothetical protein